MAGVLEAFLGGREARRVQDAANQANAMNAFLQQNGQAVFNGDPNALGQLAGMGPQGLETAFNVRGQMEDRARVQKVDARGDQEWQMRVEEYAASKTAAERAAEAAQIEEGVKMGLGATTPQQWDALVTQAGAEELVGQFENREAIAQRYMSVAEILKGQQPQGPQSPQAKLYADQQAGLVPAGTFEGETAPKNGITITNPDGTTTVIGGSGGKPPTEGQLSTAGYLQRMTKAQTIFDTLEQQGVVAIPLVKSLAVDTKVEGYVLSPAEQSLAQAQRDWVRAKLRKESGAVIGADEMAQEIKTYFPQPGEDAATAAQKRTARLAAERQLQIGAGSAAVEAGPLTPAATSPAAGSGSQPPAAAPPAPVQLSPEAERLLLKYR
jgi:hypothetical protein